jgi:hypothetical protein
MPVGKKESSLICQLKLKITCHGELSNYVLHALFLSIFARANILIRVEKYRPNSLDDVSGHQDILATINRFVETNVLNISVNGCMMTTD